MLTGVFTKFDWKIKGYDQWILAYNALLHETTVDFKNYKDGCFYNISKREDERRDCAKYSMYMCNGFKMEIPPVYDNVNMFSSFGPKVNHNFNNYTVNNESYYQAGG